MNTERLQHNVAGIVPSKAHPGRIIAAGPITKQPGTMPYRAVLVDKDDQYVVWWEMFDISDLDGVELNAHGVPVTCTLADACTHPEANSWTEQGDYFPPEEFSQAVDCFGKRVQSHVTQVQSIFRILADKDPV